METNTITWQAYVPNMTSLYFVDYNDNLDNHEVIQQQCIQDNNLFPVSDNIYDWYSEQEAEYCQEVLDEIHTKMSEDGCDELYDQHEDEIRCLIYDRNTEDPVTDVIRNTGTTNMFYSLGVEIDGYHDDWMHTYRGESEAMSCYKVRRALRIKKGQFDNQISELVQNAGNGGELRIYFNAMFDKLISENEHDDFKTIRFYGDVEVAIANSKNGSGYNVTLPLDLTVPFSRENLFVDSQVRYAYASDVCGMCHNWCDGTQWETGMKSATQKRNMKTSRTNDHIRQEAEYDRVFQSGKCSLGDINIKRHRNVFYTNDYPCGNKCPHCGTFWVD